jgi:hypothetical protein
MSTDDPTRRTDVRAGVPTGAVPPIAAPVEHDLPAGRPSLARRYRPERPTPGVFGSGFRALIDLALQPVDGHVVVEFPDARCLRFVPTSQGWLCTAGPLHALTVVHRHWQLALDVGRHGATAQFDELGRLSAWTSSAGSIRVRRDRRGRAIAIDDHGHRLHLDWADDVVAQASTERGHTVAYEYGVDRTGAQRLTRVHRHDGVVSYTWNDGRACRRHLASVG